MTATAKVMSAQTAGTMPPPSVLGQTRRVRVAWFDHDQMRAVILATMVLISALGLVYIKDLNRKLVNDVEQLEHGREKLQSEWGQLLLEEGTLATQARIQQIATGELNMHRPEQRQIIVVGQ